MTSSPAPLRRGLGKFDYDSAIASPHDIKKALFQSQYVEGNYKKEIEKDERKRRPSQKLLSASAPVNFNLIQSYFNTDKANFINLDNMKL